MASRRPQKGMTMVGHGGCSTSRYGGLAPPLPFWIPAFAGMTRSAVGVYPGSESGTCFHTKTLVRPPLSLGQIVENPDPFADRIFARGVGQAYVGIPF